MASTAYPMTPSVSMMKEKSIDSDRKKRSRPLHSGSILLDNQENYLLYSLLGTDNISLSAAVVELLISDRGKWCKLERGVISLDYGNRAYFLRLYDLLSSQELLWEFRLYKNFQALSTSSCLNLITFEGENDGAVFGLNFSSTKEAEQFKLHLDKRHEQERKSGAFNAGVAIREQRSVAPANSVFSMGTPDSPFSNGVTPLGAAVAVPKPEKKQSSSSFFTGKKKKDKKPKIRKEDISNPTNFQHKAHVGWNQDSGFSNNVDSDPMDESIKNIIRAAGQDPNNLSKKTIKFVYDFIERYEEKATPEPPPQFSGRHQAPPPPIPLSQPISQWSAPPPPPSRNASYQGGPPSRPPPPPPGGSKFNARPLPQVPNTVSDLYRPTGVPPPPPPPPPSFTAPISSNAPPAPPPPPPMMASAGPAPPPPPPTLSNMPPPQSGRGNLLAEIQAGKQLRSVGIVEKKTSTNMDARGDVMAQIRQGAQLKHVDPTEQANRRSVSALTDMGGIAGALAKALEERRNNMQLDDSSDDDDNSDEKNEWSD